MHMNKKILKGALAGTAVIALAAGGGTFAAWSDFSEIAGNQAGAGILELQVNPNAGSDFKFDHVTMAPGGINTQRNVYVASNSGDSTPSGQLFITLKDLVGHEDGCDGAEFADDSACGNGGAGQFIDDAYLQVSSYAVNSPGECTQGYAPGGKIVTGQHGGSLKWWESQVAPYELTGDGTSIGGVNRSYLAPGQGLCVSMTLNLAYGVDNASQGDSADFTTRFDLKQAPYGTLTTPLAP
jgi:predicted ribosomally synthesized peptide with SipW-like signal peptide